MFRLCHTDRQVGVEPVCRFLIWPNHWRYKQHRSGLGSYWQLAYSWNAVSVCLLSSVSAFYWLLKLLLF